MVRALTIAGSDSGGGAGIQADLKTFSAYGVFGMSVITAITAQNTCQVTGIQEVSLEIIDKQIEAVVTDIGVDGVKTGMLSSAAIVNLVADKIEKHYLMNVVVDPVMISKSGDSLLSTDSVNTLKERLMPLSTVFTHNIPEAETLLGKNICSEQDMKDAAVELYSLGCRIVVLKGGHIKDKAEEVHEAIDIVYDGFQVSELRKKYIKTKNTHGTGCTFASAIAAGLAKGYLPSEAIKIAKRYITKAINSAPDLGHGYGPVNHLVGSIARW